MPGEEDEDERNDGLHDGGLRAREGAVGRAQHGAFGPAEHEEQGGEAEEDRAGLAVGAVLKGAHGRNPEVGIVLEALVERHRGPEARLDDLVGHVPAGGDHEEGAAEREEVVAEHVHRVGRIERLGGGLGEGLHDGVDHRRRVGGREAARETGERAGHARERMTARTIEHQGCKRHEDHVHRVARHMAEDRDDHDGRRERGARDVAHQLSEKRVDEARSLGDADAERRHERDAQRREAHEVLHGIHDQIKQVRGGEHVRHGDHGTRGRMPVVERDVGERERDHERDHERPNEEHRDVRQLVACRLNGVEEAVEASCSLRGSGIHL